MKTLQMQLDNLQWEINRLEAENRVLRDQDTEASKQVDLQLQVELATKELQEVLAKKETDFVEAITYMLAVRKSGIQEAVLLGNHIG